MSFSVEIKEITFTETDSVTYTFTMPYNYVPIVTASSTQNVNVFVDSVTKTQAIIKTSQKGTYTVHVHVIARHSC